MQNSWFLPTQIEFLFLSAIQRHERSRWGKGGGGVVPRQSCVEMLEQRKE